MTRFTSDVGRIAGELPDALAIIEPDGEISWVNQAAVDLVGVQPAHWIGRPLLDRVHPDDHAAVSDGIDTVSGPPANVRVRDGAEQWRPMEIRGRQVRGGETAGDFTVIVMRNAADR